MYFFSIGAHGQGASVCPFSSGAPIECRHGINSPCGPSTSSTFSPTRVMMCILQTTYGLSVSSTPIFAMGEPTGPMEKGMTYIVLPLMQPS